MHVIAQADAALVGRSSTEHVVQDAADGDDAD